MQVDVRLASNQLLDNGGQHGQESEEGEGKEEEDCQEEVVSPQYLRAKAPSRLRHIKARALSRREADNSRGLIRFSDFNIQAGPRLARKR